MEVLKRVLGAACVAGGIGAGVQIMFIIVGMIVDGNAIPPSMILFGLIAAVLVVIGVYEKFVKIGHAGAEAIISGLMFGAGMETFGARMKGQSVGRAILTGALEILKVMGTGFVLAILVGMILNLK